MGNLMRALVLSDIAKLELQKITRPIIGVRDVLLRISAVGVCGTDFHIFSGLANYNIDRQGQPIPLKQQPQILGHEIVGIVEELGQNVQDLSVGMRVVVDQGLNCLSRRRQPLCEYCLTGDSHQCEFYQECGITGLQGAFAEYLAIPAVNVIPIQSDLDKVEAALTEPLGCIIHSLDRLAFSRTRYQINAPENSQRIKTILIFGAGPAGLIFIQYLRNVLKYDGLLLVSEPLAKKRDLASSFGAETLDPNQVNLVEAVQDRTKGRGVELVIDACGAGAIFTSMSALIRKQAIVLLYGFGHAGVDLTVLNHLQFKEATLVCSTGASGGFDPQGQSLTYRKALDLLESQQIQVSSWITHRYQSLESVPQAFGRDHQDPDYIKGVVII